MTLVNVERTGPGVAEVVFNRPKKLNALNAEMLDGFSAAVAEVGADADVRCVIIRGEGRAFTAGFDVDRPPEGEAQGGYSAEAGVYHDWVRLRSNLERFLAVWDLDIPTIAAVHGYCLGGGTALAVCADITVVAADAHIGWPSLPLGGGMLGPASMWLIGSKRARELSYNAGAEMTGAEAAALGWANRAVHEDRVLPEARELAAGIARTPRALLRLKKLALNRVMEAQGFRHAFLYGAEWDALSHTVPDLRAIRQRIQDDGLGSTVEWFKAGGQ